MINNTHKPKVSIIISSYNHEDFIDQMMESILNQTFKNFEIIIFDDGSSDKSFKKLQSFKDDRIKLMKSPYNRGMFNNINEAITQFSQGDYIAHINSDDNWHQEKLQKQVEFLDTNLKYGAVFTDANLIDKNDIIIKLNNIFDYASNINRFQWLRKFFFENNCLCFSSAMIRKEVFDKIGLYNSSCIMITDLDMWSRICLGNYEIYVIKEHLTNFRSHDNLSRKFNKQLNRIELTEVIKNYLKINSKEDFLKIFPEYKGDKFYDNSTDYALLDFIIQKYFFLKRKLILSSKKEKREFKGIKEIKNSFLQHFLFNKINKNTNMNDLNNKIDFNYAQYIEVMTDESEDIEIYNNKRNNRNIILFALFILITLSLIFLIK